MAFKEAVRKANPVILEPIQRGASGRTICRVRAEGHPVVIGIHATDERDDNKQFVPVAEVSEDARVLRLSADEVRKRLDDGREIPHCCR